MKEILIWSIVGALFCAFLYFGYRDDFRRNPKQFFRIIIGVPLAALTLIYVFKLPLVESLIIMVPSYFILRSLKKWIKKAD